MFHLFNRTYLEHEVFYNTKYASEVISSVEKSHPISEKLGTSVGQIPAFQDYLKENFGASLENYWSEQLKESVIKKKIIFADDLCYHQLLIQFWKSIFKEPTLDFLYELYRLHVTDCDLKLVMNIDRADNYKRLRPGQLPALTYEEFSSIYEKTSEVICLRFHSKEDISFEYLLAEYYQDRTGHLSGNFLKKLRTLCWRTWLSDVYSLRNDFLGSYYSFNNDRSVKSYIEENKHTAWMLDESFNESNIEYIRTNYSPKIFIELYELINGKESFLPANVWESFTSITREVFSGKYLELLEEDIRYNRGCTFIRDHLGNEANQILASWIYSLVRDNKLEHLKRLKLA